MKFYLKMPEISSPTKKTKLVILILSTVFFAANLFFLANQIYYFSFFPLLLIIAYLFFVSIDLVFFITVFLTPLSIQFVDENFNLGLNLPSEPLLFGLMLMFFIKLLIDNPFTKRFILHPVSVFVLLQMFWMLITVFVSKMPIVSVKYFVMQLWFIVPIYFLGSNILKNKNNNFRFIILLIISVCITVIYTTIRHSTYGFDRKVGNWVMDPFYNDHTAYGAILALLLPITIGMIFRSKFNRTHKFYLSIAAFIMLLGIFLSHSRATWMSIAFSIGFAVILVSKIKFRYVIFAGLVVGSVLYVNMDNILMKLEKNRQDSSAEFVEHVQSMTNISTDASNLERINRWNAAMRMFFDNPITGVGPGTYQFLYAPYQKAKDKTIISTNAGDLGNAHSEYITPLTERGIFGLLFFLGIVFCVFYFGIVSYNKLEDTEDKLIVASLLTGLVSYLVHGFMNNFLDTDVASIIFWGFIVIIVNYSLSLKKQKSIVSEY